MADESWELFAILLDILQIISRVYAWKSQNLLPPLTTELKVANLTQEVKPPKGISDSPLLTFSDPC